MGSLELATHCLVLFLVLSWVPLTDLLAIDNGVIDEPQVQCTEDSVSFNVRTQRTFSGNIYIKGKYDIPQCRQEYFSNSFNGASFTVRIGECGMRRIRQLQPHGMNYILVFVVNFHSQFITKVDRAYNVRCFYAQIDKTVTAGLDVSMLPTTELSAQTMLMPNCEYSVRAETLNGPKVRYALVGDRLVHRWECDNPNFGMLVKNCFVNDGQGSSVRVLDSRGCPVFTPVVQGSLNYDNSLNLAYVEVWAYKFPDRSNLLFQCQIQVCNKRENECLGVTPPNCPLILKNDFAGDSQLVPSPSDNQQSQVLTRLQPGRLGSGLPAQGIGVPGGVNQVYPYAPNAKDLPLPPDNNKTSSLISTPGLSIVAGQLKTNNYTRIGQLIGPLANSSASIKRPWVELSLPANETDEGTKSKRSADDSGLDGSLVDSEDIVDVSSEPVFIVDIPETEDGDTEPLLFNSGLGQEDYGVCLNSLSVGLLLTALCCMAMVIALLILYIFLRSRDKLTSDPSTSLGSSMDGGSQHSGSSFFPASALPAWFRLKL